MVTVIFQRTVSPGGMIRKDSFFAPLEALAAATSV